MAEVETLITAEQFYQMSFPDVRTELLDGEVVETGPAGFEHGCVSVEVSCSLQDFVEPRDLGWVVGRVGFILRRNPDLVRAPDVAFISKASLEAHGPTEKFWPGPPDLAVEVLSPDDRVGEVLRKVGEYLEAGTRLVWIVDPMHRIVSVYRSLHEVRVLTADEEISGEDVLPGFTLKVAEIFG